MRETQRLLDEMISNSKIAYSLTLALINIVSLIVIGFILDINQELDILKDWVMIMIFCFTSIILLFNLISPVLDTILDKHKIIETIYYLIPVILSIVILVFFMNYVFKFELYIFVSFAVVLQMLGSVFTFIYHLITNFYQNTELK